MYATNIKANAIIYVDILCWFFTILRNKKNKPLNIADIKYGNINKNNFSVSWLFFKNSSLVIGKSLSSNSTHSLLKHFLPKNHHTYKNITQNLNKYQQSKILNAFYNYNLNQFSLLHLQFLLIILYQHFSWNSRN